MRDTGMARKIDELGRIVLPVELRRLHGIRPGDALAISVDGDTIVLRKIDDACVFCGGSSGLSIFRSRLVCRSCTAQIRGGESDSRGDGAFPTVTGAADGGVAASRLGGPA